MCMVKTPVPEGMKLMEGMDILIYVLVFLYGIVIGSFLNVCIYRIPEKESIVKVRSHCMACGYQLKWYDLIPLFSYMVYRGRCRKCGQKLSVQYLLVEAVNGLLYVLIFAVNGYGSGQQLLVSVVYSLMASALLALSIIDWRTYEIPFGFNVWIGCLGLIRMASDYKNWMLYAIGFVAVSAVLELLLLVSRGRAIGGGDVKLMAAAGLVLGWKLIWLAFVLGCVLGAVIHVTRMKVSGADRVLALGPYLSVGILLAALWGNTWLDMYFRMLSGA